MGSAESLIIYLATFILSAVLFAFGHRNKNRLATFLALMLPTALGGIRYAVGADFFSYSSKLQIAENMGFFQFFNTFNKMEPAVWVIGRISALISINPKLFFVLTSFLVVLMFYLGARRLKIKHMGIFMFLVLCIIFPQSLSGVRQGVAMAFSFYAMTYIFDKQLMKFLFFTLMAAMFHFSALATILLYPLFLLLVDKTSSEKYRRNVALLVAAVPVIMLVGISLIDNIPLLSKYAQYQSDSFSGRFEGKSGTHNFLPEVVALAVSLVFYRRLVIKSAIGKFSLMMVVLMLYFNMLGLNFSLASRFADYFMPFFLLLLTGVVGEFSTPRGKNIAALLVAVFGILFFIGAFYLNKSGSIFPYNFKV